MPVPAFCLWFLVLVPRPDCGFIIISEPQLHSAPGFLARDKSMVEAASLYKDAFN